mgnify:CR=1 FL=1
MDYTNNLTFVLANTSNGYVLTTYKIGTIMIQSNATDFLQFVQYSHNEDKDGGGRFTLDTNGVTRPLKGDISQVRDILKNEHITCLVRDPNDRTYTGIVQELLGYESVNYTGLDSLSSSNPLLTFFIDNYFFAFKDRLGGVDKKDWDVQKSFDNIPMSYHIGQMVVKDLVTQWLGISPFRDALFSFFKQAIPVYWKHLANTSHIKPWHYPLHKFIEGGHINNYSIKHLQELSFEYDNKSYRHSNELFLHPMRDVFNGIMGVHEQSNFKDIYTEFISREYKYYNHLILGEIDKQPTNESE